MKKLILLIMCIFLLSGCNNQVYTKNLFYMDTFINVKIYSSDKKKALDALSYIDQMYNDYDMLADRYKSHDGVINIKYINEMDINQEIKIDNRLYEMIEYSKSFHAKTNGLFNIALGNVIDVWSEYRNGNKTGVPTTEELLKSGSTSIDDLSLLGNDTIMKKGDVSLDLGAIAKGYVTELAGEYLEGIGLNKYLITAGTSSVKVGEHYRNDKYKIGLTDPLDTSNLYKTVKGNNISVTTSGSYDRYYEYDGVKYHHIINPNTFFPSNNSLAVTVITDDAALGEVLSTTLFLMSVDEGKKYISDMEGVEAIWYEMDGGITLTDGMSNYE